MKTLIALACALLVLVLVAYSCHAQTITTLDYPGASSTMALGINNSGDIVGQYTLNSVASGFVYSAGQFTSLACPGAQYTIANGINDSGTIVGSCDSAGFIYSAGAFTYLYHPKASLTLLWGINNSGVIFGRWVNAQTNVDRSFVYEDSTFIAVGLYIPGSINSASYLAGTNVGKSSCTGYVYAPMPTSPPSWKSYKQVKYPGASWTTVGAVNDNGVVTGNWGVSGGTAQSFIHDLATKAYTPFSIDGAVNSEALGINNGGTVVGWWNDGTTWHGFVRQ